MSLKKSVYEKFFKFICTVQLTVKFVLTERNQDLPKQSEIFLSKPLLLLQIF